MISTLAKSAATVIVLAAAGVQAAQNSLQQVTGISPNPNNVGMYVYKPTKLASPPPLIVAIHYCTGSAQAYFSGTQYATLADTYGYIVIYPDSPRSGKCFDVNTPQTLSHDGGGDSQGIASMIKYAIANYGVDPKQVYVSRLIPSSYARVNVAHSGHRHILGRHDDQRYVRLIPRLIPGCIRLLRCPLRLFRWLERLEQSVR